jgi:hypothetical protein
MFLGTEINKIKLKSQPSRLSDRFYQLDPSATGSIKLVSR